MTQAEKSRAEEWVRKHAKKWQTLRRGQWKYKFHEKTLVRYLPEVSMDESIIPLVLEYLSSPDCVETLSLYDQTVDGSWTPNSAWLERGNRAVGNVASVALFHALSTDVEADGDGPYLVHDGCAYKVSFTYYWKQEQPIEVPQSTSGVSYTLTSLSRDQETGLYTYALEKRERVRQNIPQYVAAEDLERKVSKEDHYGVREGEAAGLDAGCDGAGTTVTRSVSKNDDCTHNVSNTIEKDKPVSQKVTERSRGLRGTVESETSINQADRLDDSALEVGESVRNEKTASGLWNTVRRLVKLAIGGTVLRDSCDKTIYRHSHSRTTAVGEDPGFTHVENAAGGVVKSADVRRTEEGWDVTKSERTDVPVQKSSVSVSRRLGTKVTTTHNKSQPAEAPADGLGIGDEVRNDKTDSGLYDQTIVQTEPENTPLADESCDKTRHVHSHSRTDYVKEDPGRADADDVADGKVHSVRVRKTDAGGFAVSEETKTAKASSTVSMSESEGATTTRTHLRNVPEVAAFAPVKDINRTVETSAQTNEFDLQDGAVSVTDYRPMQRTVLNETRFAKRRTTVKENEADDQEPYRQFETGKVTQVSSNPNGHGSSSVRVEEVEGKPWQWSTVYTNTNRSSKRTTVTRNKVVLFRNLKEPPPVEDGWDSVSPNFHMNEMGLWDGSIHYSTLVRDDISDAWHADQFDKHKRFTVRIPVAAFEDVEKGSEGEADKPVPKLCYNLYEVHCRILFSTQYNMLTEMIQFPGFPGVDSSLVSRMEGNHAVIFMECEKIGEEYQVLKEAKAPAEGGEGGQ